MDLSLSFQLLLCNFLAQTEAWMKGKSLGEVEAELKASGKSQEAIDKIKPHKVSSQNINKNNASRFLSSNRF